MASKDDKLLKALRSLSPPKARSSGDGPPQEPPPPKRLEAGVEDRPDRRRRGISLSVEEVGVFFLAAVVLVVFAFLMGWYGRGLTSPRGSYLPGAKAPGGRGAAPLMSVGPNDARDLGAPPPLGVRRPDALRELYTILATRFPLSDSAKAESHRRFIGERGFTPAWYRPTKVGIELYVGEFDSPHDPLARRWLERIRRLREAYRSAQIVKIRRRVRKATSLPPRHQAHPERRRPGNGSRGGRRCVVPFPRFQPSLVSLVPWW